MDLRKCLDSLVNQSLSSIEIIIVNDGSTDGSEQIIKEFASSYTNIIHITQNNMGLSEARNTGVRYATGDYIAFLDSDDWVVNDAYKILYEKAIKNNDDIVCCGFYMAYDDSNELKKVQFKQRIYQCCSSGKDKNFQRCQSSCMG
ncbi:glycosyltransferase family 2 protein [Enterobacter cloacae complex sp. 277I4]|uniref:glycosyltransferase family 2 protein n=1 Tax=Enterobacter cloacae complex sp. 277I4 TaxID=3395873 RepID=UPI003CE87884